MASATVTDGQEKRRGAFIVLEGLDRSGKTTQVKLLGQKLSQDGHSVHLMRFPDRTTPIGQMIDGYLRSNVDMDDHAIHLLFSANRWEAAKNITKLLESGTTVVSDRYFHSGMVYSVAKHNPALGMSWARAPERGLPRPDLVVFLDLEPEAAAARGGWGDEKYEKAEMQLRVRELFRALAGLGQPSEGVEVEKEEEGDLEVVDAGGSVEAVAEGIWALVRRRVGAVVEGKMGGVRTVR